MKRDKLESRLLQECMNVAKLIETDESPDLRECDLILKNISSRYGISYEKTRRMVLVEQLQYVTKREINYGLEKISLSQDK